MVTQTVNHSSFVVQIVGDNNAASMTVNINALDGVPASVHAEILDKARRRLDGLPVTSLPDHGHFAGSVPYVRNAQFAGRSADLLGLAARLKGDGRTHSAVVPAVVATGMGGVGKTQLAVEFAYRYGQFFFGGVFWLSFAMSDTIASEFARCGFEMELKGYGELDQASQMRQVRRAFESAIPRLLIFDNCEDEELLREHLPRTGGSRVLITSRREMWDATLPVQVQKIGVLSLDEGVELLRKLNPGLEHNHESDLEQIVTEVDGLPLALHLAGSFLNRYHNVLKPADVLVELRKENALERKLLQGAFSESELPTRHEKSVARTFGLSASKLDPQTTEGEMAWRVLTYAACLAPGEPIPNGLIQRCALGEEEDADQTLAVEDALRVLGDLGLMDTRPVIRIHRLLSRYVRSERASELHQAIQRVEDEIAEEAFRINEGGLPAAMAPFLPHLVYVAEGAVDLDSGTAAALLANLGRHLHSVANFGGAKAAYERALKIDEAAHGLDHTTVASTVNNLGLILRDLDELAGAKAAFERALKIDVAAYGPDHPNVASIVNNLGSVLLALGDLSGAKAAFERALKIDEAANGLDHPNVAIRVNNLGRVLQALGDLSGAQAAYARALSIDEAENGPNHPNVAIRVNNLGGVFYSLGDLFGARAAFERALQIDEEAYGADHPNVATRVSNLGKVLQALGDQAGARAGYDRALKILKNILPPDHPKTITVQSNLDSLPRD